MGRQEPHEIPNYPGAEWRTNMTRQKSKPLPVDDYISGNWREDEKIF